MADDALKAMVAGAPAVDTLDAASFDAVLFAGGFGVMWDYPTSTAAHSLIRTMYEAGKQVAAVCHGPIVFGFVDLSDGTPICAGKEVTGFTNGEENAVSKYEVVSKPSGPGSCQDVLTEKGGLFKDGGDWQANVCVAGNLFTGQNPQSAGPLAEAMVAARG